MTKIKKKAKLRRVVIDRMKWLRGGKGEAARLWESRLGMGCCLGHAAHQLDRKTWRELDGRPLPEDVIFDDLGRAALSLKLQTHRSRASRHSPAASINDGELSEAVREAKLKKLFRECGVILTFKGSREKSLAKLRAAAGLE